MTITEKLADYTLFLTKDTIEPAVMELGKTFFIDCLGCIIAGGQGQPSLIAIEYYQSMFGSHGTASIIASGGVKADSYHAAMINGISSHFHDYDDVMPSMNGHPSAAVLPVVLALAEEIGATGEEALIAYITGVEICDVMSIGLNQKDHKHYQRGWHTTSTLGIFGATAAAAKLLKLTKLQLVHAFGIAASESSGLKGNFGTMTKALHAGRAAAKGIFAAKMGQLGYGSNPNIMEMVEGFAYATTGELGTEGMINRMKEGTSVFINPGLTMKPYPCCKCNHNAIDAVYNLMKKYQFKAEDVEHIDCFVMPFFIDCLKYPVATTSLEGKFSMSYNLAITLMNERRPKISDFDNAIITDSAVIDLMKRIEMKIDDSIAGGAYANSGWDTKVKIILKDGRVLEVRVEFSRGESANPLSTEEVLEKFTDCMSATLDMSHTEPIFEQVRQLERLESIADLMSAIETAACAKR